jgi:hypothetical protein
MSHLNHPVRRRTRDAYPVLRPKPERIVVTLFPGDTLIFRCERRRHEWYLPIAAAFRAAVYRQAARDAAKKKGGRRA